jgi:hypothetical protein
VSVEVLITRLVREAPVIDAGVVGELGDSLRADGRPLALAIARAVEYVAEQLVDPAVALPVLAMACATLASATDAASLAGALFDVEILTPRPGPGVVVIPASSLKRKTNDGTTG